MPPSSVSEKSVPQNLEAERALLGSILLDNGALNLAVEALSKDDFFSEAHRIMFEKMIEISERNRTIDLVTLSEELSKDGLLEKAGGAAYLAAMTDGVPIGSASVTEYSRIVKETRARLSQASCLKKSPSSADSSTRQVTLFPGAWKARTIPKH